MKSLLLVLVTGIPVFHSIPAHVKFTDPTGTYILKGETKKNRIVGHSGEIRVKLLNERSAAICFFICKGYPGYETGSFIDTLLYDDDRMIYRPTTDSGCTVSFWFDDKSVVTLQHFSDPRSGCGFAKGVMVSARFEKRSSDIPVVQDLSARASH